MHKKTWTAIVEYLLGRKYYANIVNMRGTERCELCCFIFPTREEAEAHRRSLDLNRSFGFVETVSFRSRYAYDSERLCPARG